MCCHSVLVAGYNCVCPLFALFKLLTEREDGASYGCGTPHSSILVRCFLEGFIVGGVAVTLIFLQTKLANFYKTTEQTAVELVSKTYGNGVR